MKCQGWNHLAKDCNEPHDTCGNCTGHHRTCDCNSTIIKCASCKEEGHQSWNQNCPTFIKKLTELNNRNLENSTQYFPTTEPWTWSSKLIHNPPITFGRVLGKQQQTHEDSRPRQPSPPTRSSTNNIRRRSPSSRDTDTYFPTYSSATHIRWDEPQDDPNNNDNSNHNLHHQHAARMPSTTQAPPTSTNSQTPPSIP